MRIVDEGDVIVLVLDHPESNALTRPVLREFHAALDAVCSEETVRPVVVTGAGRTFSTGADLGALLEGLARGGDAAAAESNTSLSLLAGMILRLHRLPVPTIAAINGQAAGAGFSLALACDVRIASERVALNFAYGALGASPDGGMTWFLPRLVPPARASQLLLEQPVLRAQAALEEGLVSDVVAHDSLMTAALKRARRLAVKAPHSLRTARLLIEAGAAPSLEAQLRRERAAFATAARTDDLRAGVTAMLEGRRVEFTGH